MRFNKIIENINARLAGEMLPYAELLPFLDAAVDDVNTRLNTKFPVFSDLDSAAIEYTVIPDKYIRTVIIPGAVFKYYVMDEEGAATAVKYEEEYRTNLFYMERDYLSLVPEEYVEDMTQGTYSFEEGHPLYDRGLEIDAGCFEL